MGFNIEEVYQSNSDHLKSEDIGNSMPTYTMSAITQKKFDNGDQKLIAHFEEVEKSLVLNATNARAIGDLYSPDTDAWIGRQVMLFTMPVDYQGKQTMGIRVRGPAAAQHSAQTQQAAQTGGFNELNPPPHPG